MGDSLDSFVRDVSLGLNFYLDGYRLGNPSPGLFSKVFSGIPEDLNEIIVPLTLVVGMIVALKLSDQIIDTGGVGDIGSIIGEVTGPTVILIAVLVIFLIILAGINI